MMVREAKDEGSRVVVQLTVEMAYCEPEVNDKSDYDKEKLLDISNSPLVPIARP